jgi:hypothetical protein
MYVVSNSQKIPIQAVDERPSSSGKKIQEFFKIPGINMEMDPFMFLIVIVLLILIAVFIYLMMTKNSGSVAPPLL